MPFFTLDTPIEYIKSLIPFFQKSDRIENICFQVLPQILNLIYVQLLTGPFE